MPRPPPSLHAPILGLIFGSMSLALLASCGGSSAGYVPENCPISIDDQCYSTTADACAAADCPADRCTILRSYPGQVDCAAEAPPPAG